MVQELKSYTLKELSVGTSETFTVNITADMMQHFYAITGDCSPIHIDDAYAKTRGFNGKVVYGMLGASMVSTLAGVYLPGEHCLLHEVNSKFVKPIFIGDVLTVSGKVTEINDTFSEITVKYQITNAEGQKVTRGTYKAGVAI